LTFIFPFGAIKVTE